jgi:hypothetical protein
MVLIAEELVATRSFRSLASLNRTSRSLRQSTTQALWKTVMMDHEENDERVARWIDENEKKIKEYTQ